MSVPAVPVSAPRPSLRARAVSAGLWTMGGHGLSLALRLGSNLLLARLLAPEMFGVVTIAAVIGSVLMMFSDIGLSQSVIQSRRGDDPAFLDTAWTVQIVRGICLWFIALALAGGLYLAAAMGAVPSGSAYAAPELPGVIALYSFALVIAGFQATSVASAERQLDQRRLAYLGILSQLGGLAVMIPMALAFRSVWALVSGALVATLLTTTLSHLWLRGHGNRLRWDRAVLAELLHFGKWVFLSSAVGVLAVNGDRLLLAGYLDARVLGVYSIAALLVTTFDGGIQRLINSVYLPVLSEVARRDRSELRRVYYQLRLPVDFVLLFAAGALYMAGDLVVQLLYDSRYAQAGEMLRVLSLSLFVSRFGVANQAYMAAGLPRLQAVVNVVRCVSLYTLVPALYAFAGVQGAVWGVALHAFATLPVFYYYKMRLGLLDVRRELLGLFGLPAGILCGHLINLLRPQ